VAGMGIKGFHHGATAPGEDKKYFHNLIIEQFL